MKEFKIKEINALTDEKLMKQIVEQENILFGEGSIGSWNVKPFAKYGKIFVVTSGDDVVSAVEILNSFEKEKAYIYGVWTNPEYERQGHAEKLLTYSLNYLKEMGIAVFELTVVTENGKAVNLYRKMGFEICGILKDEYGDGMERYMMRIQYSL